MPRLSIRVKPGSKQSNRLELQPDGSYLAFLTARAHDGEANAALIALISRQFKVPKTQVYIISGIKSHQKVVEF